MSPSFGMLANILRMLANLAHTLPGARRRQKGGHVVSPSVSKTTCHRNTGARVPGAVNSAVEGFELI